MDAKVIDAAVRLPPDGERKPTASGSVERSIQQADAEVVPGPMSPVAKQPLVKGEVLDAVPKDAVGAEIDGKRDAGT
jgi:hypothetical protein